MTPPESGSVSRVTLAVPPKSPVSTAFFRVGGARLSPPRLMRTASSVPRAGQGLRPVIGTLSRLKLVYGVVGIDGLYGPRGGSLSSPMIAPTPGTIAADLLAQAEHGSGASAILITTSSRGTKRFRNPKAILNLWNAVTLSWNPLEKRGIIAVAIDYALELANLYAPEHLCLVVKERRLLYR